MPDPQTLAFRIVDISLLLIIAILALIYSLPILCIGRFQHRNNIFALNVCVTTVLSCLVYAGFYALPLLSIAPRQFSTTNTWLLLGSALLGYSTAFNFVLVSFHRCFSILYPQKRFFSIEAMGSGVPSGPMDHCKHPSHPSFHRPEASKLSCTCLSFLLDPCRV